MLIYIHSNTYYFLNICSGVAAFLGGILPEHIGVHEQLRNDLLSAYFAFVEGENYKGKYFF
jgi:hypothetical protein